MDHSIISISKKSDFDKLKKKHKKLIVMYGTEACPGCINLKKSYKKLSRRYQGRVVFVYIDIDKANLNFDSLPTCITYMNGKGKEMLEGNSKMELKGLLKTLVHGPYD